MTRSISAFFGFVCPILLILFSGGARASEYGEWGFQPFEVPEKTVAITSRDSLKDAVEILRKSGGGTLHLAAGTYLANSVMIPSNVVIEGAGIGQTIIKSNGSASVLRTDPQSINNVFRRFTLDATGNSVNGLDVDHGGDNVLIEDLEVFGAKKSNVIIYNRDSVTDEEVSENITIRRIKSHGAQRFHGIVMRIVRGGAVLDVESWGNGMSGGGYGLDASNSDFIEVGSSHFHDNHYGTKFPQTNHVYMYDSIIENNGSVGLKMKRMGAGELYYHLEGNVIKGSVVGAVDWSRDAPHPSFAEFVARRNVFIGNVHNYFKIRSGNLYSFGDPIRSEQPEGGEWSIIRRRVDESPESYQIGYTTWLRGDVTDEKRIDLSANN